MLKPLIVTLITSLPVVGFASGGLSPNDILTAKPISATNFEVIEGRFSGPRAYWCSAAIYVENTLGRQQSRIYLAAPKGPSQTTPGRNAVQFTTVAPADPVQSYSVSLKNVGYSLGSGHALRFCDDYYTTDRP